MANQDENAFKLWEVLTEAAKTEEKLITYGKASAKIGIHPRTLRYSLERVQRFCLESKLPPLTILVVRQDTMRPGQGFVAWDVEDVDVGVATVGGYNWDQIDNPFQFARSGLSLNDIVKSVLVEPQRAAELFALVKVRGIVQVIFRNLLLRVYDDECAFCGLSFPEALQASHIIPWSIASPAQKISPSNGILLCSTHHRLFDHGYLTIDPNGSIVYYDPTEEKFPPYSEADRAATIKLNRKAVRLPEREEHRPSDDALQYHRTQIFLQTSSKE